jgi:hypothetical protein
MAVSVATTLNGGQPVFRPGIPQPLFDAHLGRFASGKAMTYDVTPDGSRFLVTRDGASSTQVFTVEVNWDAALKK